MPMLLFTECLSASAAEHTSEMHEVLKADDAWWAAQEQKGVQKFDGRPFLALVNCRCCGSTLARRIDHENTPSNEPREAGPAAAALSRAHQGGV